VFLSAFFDSRVGAWGGWGYQWIYRADQGCGLDKVV